MANEKIKFVKMAGFFLVIALLSLLIINEIYEEHVLTKKNFYIKEIQYESFLDDLPSPQIDNLFFGDSHVFHGVNPEYINNSFNWGSGTQNYIKSYYLLNRIVNQDNLKVNTVVLQIDPHSFSEWLVSEPFLFNELELYSDFVPLSDVKKIRKNDSWINLWVEANMPVIGKGKEFGVLFFGIELSEMNFGWIKNTADFSKLNEEERKNHANGEYNKRFENYDVMDNLSLIYFEKILNLAEEENINVVLVKYPFAKEYGEMLREKGLGGEDYYSVVFNNTKKVLGEDYLFLDYSNLFPENPEFFGDATHVNYKGAEMLSKQLAKDLRGLNFENDSGEMEAIKLEKDKKDKNNILIFLLLILVFLEFVLLIIFFILLRRKKLNTHKLY